MLHIVAKQDDSLGAGERGEIDRLVAAVSAVRQALGIARVDGERILLEPMDAEIAAALAVGALDRQPIAGERAPFRALMMPSPKATIGVIVDVGMRSELVGAIYRDDPQTAPQAIAPGANAL